MSVADKQRALRLALLDVQKDMRGISPKTSSYKLLEEKRKKILAELEQIGAKRTNQT
jgi:hypothetical protein